MACYGYEVWLLKREEQRKLLALEVANLRSARVSRLRKIPNTTIKSKMQAEKSVLDIIQRRKLKWYGHLLSRRFTVGREEAEYRHLWRLGTDKSCTDSNNNFFKTAMNLRVP